MGGYPRVKSNSHECIIASKKNGVKKGVSDTSGALHEEWFVVVPIAIALVKLMRIFTSRQNSMLRTPISLTVTGKRTEPDMAKKTFSF